MAGSNAIRGSRIGAGPMGEAERGETHLAYVRERRDERDSEAILNEALEELSRKSP